MAQLVALLHQDATAGLALFRKHFLPALDRRDFVACEALLEVLAAAPDPTLGQAARHYQAVVLLEQHRYDQAEAILRDLLAEELTPLQRARSLMELGPVLDEQGHWDQAAHDSALQAALPTEPAPVSEAELWYHRALAAYQAAGDPLGQARVYNNLGISLCFQVEQGIHLEHGIPAAQRLADALAYHQKALALAQALDRPEEVAKNRHGLGKVYGLLGRYAEAQAELEAYLAWCRAQELPAAVGYTLTDLASRVHLPQRQWTKAAAALAEAIPLLQAGDDPLNLADAYLVQGQLHEQQGRPEAALAAYASALEQAETIRTRLTAPTAQARYRATIEALYAASVTLHLHRGEAAQAFTAAERARGRVLADLLAGQAARPHTSLPTNLLSRREALRQALDQAYAAEEPPDNVPALEGALAEIDHQIELADPTYAGLTSVASFSAGEVQARLPAKSALLAYAADANDHFWAFVVTPEEVHAVPMARPSVRWLRGHLHDHLDGLRQGSLMPDLRTGYLAPPRLFGELHQALLAPVLPMLASAETVYIIPFGPLHYLPLGALAPFESPYPSLLAEGCRVVYAPSATVLLGYCHTCPPSPHRERLVFAPTAVPPLSFLQGAAQTLAGADGQAVVGPNATRQAFFRQAPQARLLCCLGHALFDRRYPMSSRLQLADGNLYASEILRELRLQADLVILAACETGRGQVLRGDEVLGLTRTLLYAGTPSLLVTLWPVHEVVTRLLVEHMMAHLQRMGDAFDPALALAAAQAWLRTLSYADACQVMTTWVGVSTTDAEQQITALWQMTHPQQTPQPESQPFAHPFFWSPYILVGDRPTLAKPTSA